MKIFDTITLHVGHTVKVEIAPLIEESVKQARIARSMGSTKIDAVRQIYPKIANQSRESIWYTIMRGVDLSSRGC